ncbi:MAG TPA: hypothetical protein VNO14_11155, partial [Blastocatellia bacterium]|nr:hypothetical protein [Blastocatellia bacterium]
NEIYQFLTGNPNVQLSPKQLGELINAIVEHCGKKGKTLKKFRVTRPRIVGGGPNMGNSFGAPWWSYSLLDFLLWLDSIQVQPKEDDHYA